MEDIQELLKEDRIKKILFDIKQKYSFINSKDEEIPDNKIIEILEKIEDRIYYISDSPSFNMNIVENGKLISKSFNSSTISGKDTDELIKYFLSNTEERFFIIYNMFETRMSTNTNYLLRGVYIDDPCIKKMNKIDRKIETILDKKSTY